MNKNKKRMDKAELTKLIEQYAKLEARPWKAAEKLMNEHDTGRSQERLANLITMHRKGTTDRKDGMFFGAPAEPTRKVPTNELDEIFDRFVPGAAEPSAKHLAHRILAETPGLDYSVNHLTKLIRDYKKRHDIETTIRIKSQDPDDKYVVIDGTYKWKAKHGEMSIPVELADQMFYEYSRHGLDMSQAQMRQKHGLKIWEWNAIKNTLFLYKDANVFSPHTEDNTPPESLQEMIDDRIGMKFKDRQRLVETSYNKATIKEYKKVIEKDQIQSFALESLISELNDLSDGWHAQPATINRTPDFKTERRWVVVTIADLHIGARVENLNLTPDYSPDRVRHLLDQIARRVNESRATDVTLAFMGDLIESFTGMNHQNTWHDVEYAMIGARLIKEAMSIIEEFIAKVDNVRQILCVGGNHDRIPASKKDDPRGQVAEIIFYLLDRLYGGQVEVCYENLVMSKQVDGIQYVMSHGDKNAVRDGRQAVIDHGDSKLFNVILTAHVHSRRVNDDQKSYRWYAVPPVFTGNQYSEDNGWHARPGFQTFENDGTGRPLVTDHTIG
jgi:UDP-2,3-diacylglucosamine pyrophosphatase LpxH